MGAVQAIFVLAFAAQALAHGSGAHRRGPITAWMAPYRGDIAEARLNDLEFFKIAEDTVDENGVWGTVRMMDKTNHTWTATIPADIQPGTYKPGELAWIFNLTASVPFVPAGPPLYRSSYDVQLAHKGVVVVSPAGQGKEADNAYYKQQALSLDMQYQINSRIDANGG
ncbi:hypothetical protein B0T14DRAFT_491182 [Immersiella caudata]|uniref:lytic cellulose monooxygenase (C4-dehydrogenating) n=1 Tax=Immersiella caudata TaxID=314043 RepID=A0AA40CC32_9PEZI|nr:hypothetical protein B0T14DRAFT_491182 [Immersiella caudata]